MFILSGILESRVSGVYKHFYGKEFRPSGSCAEAQVKDTQHAAGLFRGGIPGLPNAKM